MSKTITHCMQCGTCCKKGGPALHLQDKELLRNGHIRLDQLITIRKGEMAFFPLSNHPEPTPRELVKINGKGGEWECIFFDRQQSLCTFYSHRPLECRLLQCWDTRGIMEIIGHDTLVRTDIIRPDAQIIEFITLHEQECPCTHLVQLVTSLTQESARQEILHEVTTIVRKDLAIRSRVVTAFNLSLPMEIFFFGRPLHTIMETYGFSVYEYGGEIQLDWNPS